jgi:hypothetical protein
MKNFINITKIKAKNLLMNRSGIWLFVLTCLMASISLISCEDGKSDLEAISRLSTSATRLIEEYKFDSAKVVIDSLKNIGADTAYIKAMEDAIIEKEKFIENTQGLYVYSSGGVKVEILLDANNTASLSSSANGRPINGVNSKGTYTVVGHDKIKISWEEAAFNEPMGELTYDSNEQTLMISNGTIYKKGKSEVTPSSENEAVPKKATPKKYVMFCGEEFEEWQIDDDLLPGDWQNRAGNYCLRNYGEGASSVYFSGFNNAGILVTAVGEQTGEKHIILFLCDGSLY